METTIIQTLLSINQRFYQSFGAAFAATRRRIQPGVRRVLSGLPQAGNWLDLGCGSGALAVEWAHSGRSGLYFGLDFSEALLAEARQATASLGVPDLEVRYAQADISAAGWAEPALGIAWDGVLAFASLHHIPSAGLRLRVLRQVRALLPAAGLFIHSEWQFQHSPKLMARRQPWEAAGLNEADVEAGDTLLDWRYALPGQPEQSGLRYVHLFNREELEQFASKSGFKVLDTFESDGEGGRLGLYQVWQAVQEE